MWSEPGAALLDWRNRFNMALAELEHQHSASNPKAARLPATRQRLQHLHDSLQRHNNELNTLLAPLKVGEALARETHLALATQLPGHHGVLSYSTQIFRDWCWGDDENGQVADYLVQALKQTGMASANPRILVLGCGAGRLAYDLHSRLSASVTWALDSNPFLCLLGQAVSSGQSLQLTEFPTAPLLPDDVAVTRQLSAPGPVEDLFFVCADATRPPFAAQRFDLVVTPWLIDVIDVGLAPLLRIINKLLCKNGLWLNHGSVAFAGGAPENRLTSAEIEELTEQHGFAINYADNAQFPYLQSPASRHHRQETVFTQIAARQSTSKSTKTGTATQHLPQHLPEWIVRSNVPVPLSDAFKTQITTVRIHAFIMGLIDGQRDINAMAAVLEEQRLMPATQAVQAIRGFLKKMYEEAVTADGHGGQD